MDIKRNIIWVIFGTSLFLLWDNWMVAQGNASFFAPAKPVASKSASAKSDLPSVAGESSQCIWQCAGGGARQ